MTLDKIFGISAGGLFVLLTLVQISPIKIDPWSWLARKVGKMLNGEVLERMDALEKKVEKVEKKVDNSEAKRAEDKAIAARVRILRYGDEERMGIKHSKGYSDQIMGDIQLYTNHCREYPDFENGITEPTCDYIKKGYLERMMKNDFLQ